ncbi:rab11 family-interacting protein 3-like isoform X2 [Protopterus annectens]|uniref:rab11 family-interacting protein 3-like isoform X2 n=1 Tax=Protopterus annectens TaxID=7888 RepID=UPI001CFABE11|nr:rab11 family-interacting protein 3-like isoform X2 [Protopterus annectens]
MGMLPMEPDICISPSENWTLESMLGNGLGSCLGELHHAVVREEFGHTLSLVAQNPEYGDGKCKESNLMVLDTISADALKFSLDHVDQGSPQRLISNENSVKSGSWDYLILNRMDPDWQHEAETEDPTPIAALEDVNRTDSLLLEDDAYLRPSSDQDLLQTSERECLDLEQILVLTEFQVHVSRPNTPDQNLDICKGDQPIPQIAESFKLGGDAASYTKDCNLLLEVADCSLTQDTSTCTETQGFPLSGSGSSPQISNREGCNPELSYTVTKEPPGSPCAGLLHQQAPNTGLSSDVSEDHLFTADGSFHDSCDTTTSLTEYTVPGCTADLVDDFSIGLMSCKSLDDNMDAIGAEVDVSKLQAVFEALDRDGDGFVRIEEFIQFATVYGAEQVKDLTKYLDPTGLGVISFEDFYRGIATISSGDPDSQLYDMGYSNEEDSPVCIDDFDEFVTYESNEVTDSAYMGSESAYSECETFTDEDTGALVHHELPFEVENDSAIDTVLHSGIINGSSLLPPSDKSQHDNEIPNSDFHNHSIVTIVSGEEHFEDYGEGIEEFICNNLCQNGETSIDCINEDSFLLSPSPNKRLSRKKIARQLHHSLMVHNFEELSRDIMDQDETDLVDKVVYLEKRVTELEKESTANGEQHSRLKHENLQLVHRANALEEQLKEQESKAEDTLQDELRRQKEILMKVERERSIEIENLQARLLQLDEENSELRSCVPCLKANIERLEEEKRKLQDEIEDITYQLNEEQESKRKLADKLSHEQHQSQCNREATQELIEDLRKQLEQLQLFKLDAERRGRSNSSGLQEYNCKTREAELELEIRRLKQDNRALKEQNDELNGQIINLSIQGAKNLFSPSFSESLAAEISSVSRDELMEAIQKQEEINFRLQDYIDRIIVAIMESNPSILEVK